MAATPHEVAKIQGCAPSVFLSAIDQALAEKGQSPLTKIQQAVVYAQMALETDYGKSCWNYNYGNARGVAADGAYVNLGGATERNADGTMSTPTVQRFRAFATPLDGARYYVSSFEGQWAKAWAAALAGNLIDFAQKLKDAGYYTATLDSYTAGLKPRFDLFLAKGPLDHFVGGSPTNNYGAVTGGSGSSSAAPSSAASSKAGPRVLTAAAFAATVGLVIWGTSARGAPHATYAIAGAVGAAFVPMLFHRWTGA